MDEQMPNQESPQIDQLQIQEKHKSPWKWIALGLLMILIVAGLSYYLRTQITTITNPEIVHTPSNTPSVTDITPSNSDTYLNEIMGYSIQIPSGWFVKEDGSSYGPATYLLPNSCRDEFENAKNESRGLHCTHIVLPQNIGGTGWGYGNNRQESTKVVLTNGFNSERSTFYYDDSEYISWNVTSAANLPTPSSPAYAGTFIFATVFHHDPSNASLKNIYEIVESIKFSK